MNCYEMVHFSFLIMINIAPEPYRNQINHVSNISYIVDKIVEIKGINYDEFESLVSKNTRRLFKKIK